MKILHINASQEGGAALCALRINQALINQGVESKMLFRDGSVLPENVEGAIAERDKVFWKKNFWTEKVHHLLMRMPLFLDCEKLQMKLDRANIEWFYVHQPLSYYTNISHHPLIEWADIIHLHWVPGFVDYPSFFKNVKKPVVWTLHDMYPAIGVLHFESGYTIRPKGLDKVDALCRKIKKKSLSKAYNLHLVAISEMMQGIIKDSDQLKDFPVTLIHNGVDTKIFRPITNEPSLVTDFVSSLGENTKVFLFSSYSISDKRKGLDRVIKALESVKAERDEGIVLIVIGGIDRQSQYPKANFPIYCIGLINDQHELAKIYSVADYFISASYEEGFAQTPLEAMACGTPVISTPCSGARDLIRDFNGVVCDGYDPADLTRGILSALDSMYYSEQIRDYIIENYDYAKIAKEYIALYEHVLSCKA